MAGERCLTTVTSGCAAVTWMACLSGPIKFRCIVQAPTVTASTSCLPSSRCRLTQGSASRFLVAEDGKEDLSSCARTGGFASCSRLSSRLSLRSRTGGGIRANLKPNAEEGQDAERQSISPNDDSLQEQSAPNSAASSSPALEKEISKAVRKTAATFAPRSSTAKKNPATPGSTLYTIFEVQAYVSMAVGGILSFNLLFPSEQPDLWRLMGMWSVWMLTIPSLRARDCPSKEKDALNYLFLLIPLLNVTIPIFWKSFAAVWSADVLAFFAMYAWKLEWIGGDNAEGGQ